MTGLVELPLHLDFYPEGSTLDVWVHLKGEGIIVLKDVAHGSLYDGWWSIEYRLFGLSSRRATALIPGDRVQYFSVVENIAKEEANSDADFA
jgi:hypothetical protein